MRGLAPSISPWYHLILLYRVNGECAELSLVLDETEEDGVYSVNCKYTKKSS